MCIKTSGSFNKNSSFFVKKLLFSSNLYPYSKANSSYDCASLPSILDIFVCVYSWTKTIPPNKGKNFIIYVKRGYVALNSTFV